MENILGDYRAFFRDLRQRTADAGIDIEGCSLSHVAFRTATLDEYGVADRADSPASSRELACQPAYLTFENGRTAKFYRYSLQDVVEMEGRPFVPYGER